MPKSSHNCLNQKQMVAIQRLLTPGLTLGEIAKELGVSRRTLYSWRKRDPLFQETFQKSLDSLLQKHIESIASSVNDRLSSLMLEVNSYGKSTFQKLRALDRLISSQHRVIEGLGHIELRERLKKLEEVVAPIAIELVKLIDQVAKAKE